jgi:hypothetical protein
MVGPELQQGIHFCGANTKIIDSCIDKTEYLKYVKSFKK